MIEIVEEVAWPDTAKPEYEGGVRWFKAIRNQTCSGYFSTEAGWNYMGYVSFEQNAWNGVPQEVMNKHGFQLEEKQLPVYLKLEDRDRIAEWDADGNLT